MKIKIGVLTFLLCCFVKSLAQTETSEWKFQIAFGFNNPIDNQRDSGFYTKYVNFPSINLGIQHMFNERVGAKLDFGYNRAVSAEGSTNFKLNYSRVNAQFVYDLTHIMKFLPPPMSVVGHIGPGISFSKPLANYSENTYTYPNLLAGLEVHFGIAQTVSLYGDISYALGLSGQDKYDLVIDGYSFNGDLLYVTIGVSVSLSGCYYCD